MAGSEVQPCLPPNGHLLRQSLRGGQVRRVGKASLAAPGQIQGGTYTCSWRLACGRGCRLGVCPQYFFLTPWVLFTSAGLAGQTDAVSQQVSWLAANRITHQLCVGTILGASGIAGSKQTAPCLARAHILLGRESVSQKRTRKCQKHSAHLSQS